MNGFLLKLVALAAIGWLAWTSAFQVGENESVIVTRLGDPRRLVEEPGLHFKLPAPIDAVLRVDRRLRVLDPEPTEYLTSDKKNVLVNGFVAWEVEDPERFLKSARDVRAAEARLQDVLVAEVGNILGAYPLSALVASGEASETMANVNAEITRACAAAASENFGIRVETARIKRLTFPRQNKQAVFRRMEAERQKIAKEIRSQGMEEADKIRADAKLEASKLLSEASREAATIVGEAEAESTRIYAEAYGADSELYEFLRTLETYEEIFDEDSLVVIPDDSPLLRVFSGPDAPLGARRGVDDDGVGEGDR